MDVNVTLIDGNGKLENSSNTNGVYFTEKEILIITYLWYAVIPVTFGVISAVGIVGNSLVIYVILSKRDMQNVTNLLLLNLAFADVTFILLVIPYTAVKFAAESWPFGDAFCKLVSYFQYVSVYVTVYTLVVISTYRYVTVVWGSVTSRYRTKRNAVIVIVALWLIVMCLNIPTLLMHRVKTFDKYKYCGQTDINDSYYLYLTFFIFAYVLPLTTICVLYALIVKHLHDHQSLAFQNNQSKERTTNACRIVVIVVVVFGVCWLPMHIHFLLAVYQKTPNGIVYEVFRFLWHCFAYANSCANPIIYNFASSNFRQYYRKTICSCKEKNRSETQNGVQDTIPKHMVTVNKNGKFETQIMNKNN